MATQFIQIGKLKFPVNDGSEDGTPSYIQDALDSLKIQQEDPLADAMNQQQSSGGGDQALLGASTPTGPSPTGPDMTPAGQPGAYGGGSSGGEALASQTGGLGLGPEDQAAYDWIIQHESGGDPNAQNPTSTAFGRGQLLDYNRASYAQKLGISDPNTHDPNLQDKMAMQYITERYGTPTKAKEFWQAHGWY
jgi:hypothetical protein